eukprot:Blabericola_migrator_1__9554@NODE_5200_length_848_cov_38_017926_g3313_i0_p1_GENE_NODE_5200_length_848_cov_38_017926_g3313_i0NODE_5200_length_848_cov_38_017926_g3313_i0_p1_ORF_typecomplete_len217_score27_88_NODE_5200_length_848_cov_38_017926_g3313_i0197847
MKRFVWCFITKALADQATGKLLINSASLNATYPALNIACYDIAAQVMSLVTSAETTPANVLTIETSFEPPSNESIIVDEERVLTPSSLDEEYDSIYVRVPRKKSAGVLVPLRAYVTMVSAYLWCTCLNSLEPVDTSPLHQHCGEWCSRQIYSCSRFWTTCPTNVELLYCWSSGFWEDRSCSVSDYASDIILIQQRAAPCLLNAVLKSGPIYYGPLP